MKRGSVIEFANMRIKEAEDSAGVTWQPIMLGKRREQPVTQVATVADIGSCLSALQSARSGIQRGLSGLAADAQAIAHANVDSDNQVKDLSDAMASSLVDRIQVQVAARVMRTADQMIGTLLDVKA